MIRLLALATLGAPPLAAQHDHAQPEASPYTTLTTRPIKALAPEDVGRLLNGEGMGYALAAELNHYPGPKHTLEPADELALAPETLQAIEAIRTRMTERARALGAELVAAEAALDSAFANRTITPEELAARTARIGTLTGTLRAAHLAAHLEVTALLSAEQVGVYDQMRGYGRDGH